MKHLTKSEMTDRSQKKKDILDNWDEIVARLNAGQSVDLENFVPDEQRREGKNKNIINTLENKRKL